MSAHDEGPLLRVAAAVADRTPVDWNREAGSRPDLQPRLQVLQVLETLTALHDPVANDPLIGSTLTHFRIDARIGAGGMGVVYRAEDEKLRRPVALKVLPPELTGDDERRLRFLREARAAAAVTHPNIATVYEVGESDGRIFIAMELIEGRTLRNLIGDRPLPIQETLRLAAELAEGLARAHQAHVIHRDLKPDNVIVTPEGHAKILDFGLAKLRDDRSAADGGTGATDLDRLRTISANLSREGKVMGTPAYMSPEQARGRATDLRSDLFSFGTMLYEMTTGRVPFEGSTVTDLLSAIVRDRPAPAADRNLEVPAELDRIISSCLEKDPADRYQHTDQLAVDLRKLLRTTDSGVPAIRTPAVAVGRVTPATATPRAGARPAARHALLAAVAALAIAAGGLSAWQAFRPAAGFDRGDRILVADFDNRTRRPEFDSAIRDAFENMLAASTLVGVIRGNDRADLVKQRIGAEAYRIDGAIADRICRDGGCAGYLIGAIESRGDGFRLEAALYRAGRQDPVAAQTAEAPGEPDLLAAIHGMTLDLRREIRENPEAVSGTIPPSTRSLLAYQAYASRQGGLPDALERVALLQRALEIDPGFADAWSGLAIDHANLGDDEAYRKYAEEAYRRSANLTDQARLLKEILVFDANYDHDAMIEHLISYRRLYPFDGSAANWLGLVHLQYYEDPVSAEPALRAAYEIQPGEVSYGNLVHCLSMQGKIEAIEQLKEDYRRWSLTQAAAEDSLTVLWIRRDLPALRAVLDRGDREHPRPVFQTAGLRLEVFLSFGRLAEAREAAAVAWSGAIATRFGGAHQGVGLVQAWLEWRSTGRPPELHPAIPAATETSLLRLAGLATYAAETGPVPGLAGIIDSHARRKADLKSRFVRDELEFARGCLAFSRGDARGARAILEPLARSRDFQRRHHVLGRVYESLELWPEAAAEYERVLKDRHKTTLFCSAVQVLDQFRLARIYDRLGQSDRAHHWYGRFLDEWKEADPDLPEVIEARGRLASLAPPAGPQPTVR